MPTFGERDYEDMAKRAVDKFLSRKAELADAAADEARGGQLNPDQIERMVQAANTQAFLSMMDKRKQDGAGDLLHEFDPIDSRQVIKIVIDQNGVHVDGPHDNDVSGGDAPACPPEGELPDEMGAMRAAPEAPGDVEEPEEEEAPEDPSAPFPGPKSKKKDSKKPEKKREEKSEAKEASYSPAKQQAVRLRMRKVAEHLVGLRAEAEVAFEDQFNKLASRFRGLYTRSQFEEFEKSALVEHAGPEGLVTLAMLRTTLRQPAVDLAEKRAALYDRHISTDTAELRSFGDLCKIAKGATRLEAAIKWIEERCAISPK